MQRPTGWTPATVALAAVPVALYVGVLAAWSDRDLFYSLVAEDKLFEWLQVGLYGLAALGFAAVAVAIRRRRGLTHGRAASVVAALGALLFVVVIGEEISWGQRHWDVRLTAVERVNQQGDLTLHNVGAGLAMSQVGLLGLAVVGAAAPFLHRIGAVRRRFPAVAERFRPPVWLAGWFATAAVFTLARLLVLRTPPFQIAKLSEVAELSVAAGAAVAAALVLREVLQVRHGGAAPA